MIQHEKPWSSTGHQIDFEQITCSPLHSSQDKPFTSIRHVEELLPFKPELARLGWSILPVTA